MKQAYALGDAKATPIRHISEYLFAIGTSSTVRAYPSTNVMEVQVAGQAGTPGSAEAVVLNVTATDTEGDGYVTVWPCGQTMPDASNLNFVAGRDVPNAVVPAPTAPPT